MADNKDDVSRRMAALKLGYEFSAAVGGFCFIGWLVDWFCETKPWGLLIGAILGLIGGMYNLIRDALRMSRDQDQHNPPVDKS